MIYTNKDNKYFAVQFVAYQIRMYDVATLYTDHIEQPASSQAAPCKSNIARYAGPRATW